MNLNKLSPSKWSLHCWLAVCVWLLVTVLVNLPWLPSPRDLVARNDALSQLWLSGDEFYVQAGWPHAYVERQYLGSSASVSDKWMLDGLATNILLAIPTLLLLVYTLQFWLPRPTLRTIFIGKCVDRTDCPGGVYNGRQH